MKENSLATTVTLKKNLQKLSPDKRAQAFVTQISENRCAYDLFKKKALQQGFLGRQKPLQQQHNDYYTSYIKPMNITNDRSLSPTTTNDNNFTQKSGSRNRYGGSQQRRKPFIPLGELLTKNHNDRVADYLTKMKGFTIDEIVNSNALNHKSQDQPQTLKNQDRQQAQNHYREQEMMSQTLDVPRSGPGGGPSSTFNNDFQAHSPHRNSGNRQLLRHQMQNKTVASKFGSAQKPLKRDSVP